MKILAIETSCDDTSASVLEDSVVLSNVISSQDFHTKYGGIVPELASRSHTKVISQIVDSALIASKVNMHQIDALAVTSSPGLAGSLLVGSNFAKGLSIKYDLPIVPINHIEGHIFSGNLQKNDIEFPLISLVASGGHTAIFHAENYSNYQLVGSTIDDAAGEAFDKIAKMLALGYPGGPLIDKLAQSGDELKYDFPRSLKKKGNYDFSFSGLKTSVRYFLKNNFPDGFSDDVRADICASVQLAIAEILVCKTINLAKLKNVKTVVIGGGVSANSKLRELFKQQADKFGMKLVLPDIEYCVDNAAMIGFIAEKKIQKSSFEFNDLTFTVNSNPIRSKPKKR